MVLRRAGVWVSVFRNSIIPQYFFGILAAISECQNTTGRPVPNRGLRFYLVLEFVLSVQHVNLTQILDGNLSHSGLPRARVSLSLDTSVVGEVDELEGDVGWSMSYLEGVIDVEEGKLEEELDDKPGTTIGTKFSVLHCIRIPFLMWCSFWPVIHS